MTQCFDCHAGDATRNGALNLPALHPGITCERCHGAADAHLRGQDAPRHLGGLDAGQMSEFCGQCRRTFSNIMLNGPRGILNVRFQPYRLAGSRCFDPADPRIRCTACHDPHVDVARGAASYDSKCQACHSGAARKAKAKDCPVSNTKRATCHMPRTELPDGHISFADYYIRVVRPGDSYAE